MKITNGIFACYLNCKRKSFMKHTEELGIKTDYERLQDELKADHHDRIVRGLIEKHAQRDVLQNKFASIDDLRKGKRLLLGITLEYQDIQAQVDALKKQRGRSGLGSFYYVPVLFSHKNKIRKDDKLLLSFLGHLVGNLQGRKPSYGKILYGEYQRSCKINLQVYEAEVDSIVENIRTFGEKGGQPRVLLNRHCDTCEFRDCCEREAEKNDDLSLLRGMSQKEILAQNRKGIFTVGQFSCTFRPRKRRKRGNGLDNRRYHALQALAIREQKVFVYGRPEDLPDSSVRVYMDVESVPDSAFVYLIGMIVDKRNDSQTHSLWADSRFDQTAIFEQFLEVVETYDDFVVYHYGSYETKVLKAFNRSYEGSHKSTLDSVLNKSVNILSLIYPSFYFPVYANSLKAIGGYLGFRWTEKVPSGLKSIVMRKEWEKTRRAYLKDRLVRYNFEDCCALRIITEYLEKISTGELHLNTTNEKSRILSTDDFRFRNERTFKKNVFALQDFEYINRCAYFDYQREKIFVRANKRLKRQLGKRSRRKEVMGRANRIIKLDRLEKCPNCGCEKLHRRGYHVTSVIDLKFVKNGVKRWYVKFHNYRFRCTECDTHHTPKTKDRRPYEQLGSGLMSWTVYENIVKGVSFEKIQQGLKELFNLSISRTSLHNFKSYAASYYKNLYKKILDRMTENSTVIHVDETSVKLIKSTGYVWVFANTEGVIFMYRPTREGGFLHELLEGFDGVLISDSYGAYDSLNCFQQKCLVHLIRDMNDDLRKHPFDDELRSLVQSFSSLLKGIVETVDRYGLKTRYLKRHNRDVNRFNKRIFRRSHSSDVAIEYQKRFEKNREKLFTFLNFDGVPWNNNNAEHAIKHFAAYRHKVNGMFSEKGLNDYLTLLSIYQTCRYRGLNFLEFLLSRKTSFSEKPLEAQESTPRTHARKQSLQKPNIRI